MLLPSFAFISVCRSSRWWWCLFCTQAIYPLARYKPYIYLVNHLEVASGGNKTSFVDSGVLPIKQTISRTYLQNTAHVADISDSIIIKLNLSISVHEHYYQLKFMFCFVVVHYLVWHIHLVMGMWFFGCCCSWFDNSRMILNEFPDNLRSQCPDCFHSVINDLRWQLTSSTQASLMMQPILCFRCCLIRM